MDLLQLKYFYEVANSLHVTRSAEKLHVAQPSLTQTIRRLERELGVKLFKVQGRNIAITEYGEFLKNEIEPILRITNELPAKLAEISESSKNTVKINMLTSAEPVITAISEFKKANKDIKIKIFKDPKSYGADITVYSEAHKKNNDRDPGAFVFTESISLAVPNNEQYANVSSIDVEDLKDKEFISVGSRKQFRQMCEDMCVLSGFVPNIVFESDSFEAVRDMVGLNAGVALWPQFSWSTSNTDTIKLLKINADNWKRDILVKLDTKTGRGNEEASKAVYDAIVTKLSSLQK